MTQKINLLLTMPFPQDLVADIQTVSPLLNVTQRPAKEISDIPNNIWAQTEILYTNHIIPTKDIAPNLRWIQFHWAGIDRLSSAPILQDGDVYATTLSGAHAPQMGEYVVMMLLALGHKMPTLVSDQAAKRWDPDRWHRFLPFELRGSTVGVVGYGSIGREVARLLKPFDVTVLATKKNVMQPEDTGYVPEGMGDPDGNLARRLYPAPAIREMLKLCDFIVVAVPLTPENTHLFGPDEFAVLKPNAFIVDVSRGNVIDHEALIQALRKGTIAGAALDVFPEEPLPPESPLWDLPNCLITPHISGVTPNYDKRAVELFKANINRYLSGAPLYNQFDKDRGY